jgi:hypothetical protein
MINFTLTPFSEKRRPQLSPRPQVQPEWATGSAGLQLAKGADYSAPSEHRPAREFYEKAKKRRKADLKFIK